MKARWWLAFILILLFGFYWSLPEPLFNSPLSTLLLSSEGELLSARIAEDEQWRFPEIDSVPTKLESCVLLFEDEYFYYHPGINPISLIRAVWQNLRSDKIISGGSTISMQVIRLSRSNPPRSYIEKVWEIILALRLEFSYDKEEILKLYASNAPYGGNVVGMETASWRYFNRPPQSLSWSESAMLAVLPNSPSLIHPGRNRTALKTKRNRLLLKLLDREVIDSMTYSLAIMEKIPEEPKPLPQKAYHLLTQSMKSGMAGKRIVSNLNAELQEKVNASIDQYVQLLVQNEVHNACAIVVSLKDQKVIAYTANASIPETRSPYVDLIQASRSSGSILKPILYGKAIDRGLIHSSSLLKDVPISIDQFSPKNFDGEFEGIVPASKALSKSLNVPATLLLKDYGIPSFLNDLKSLEFSSLASSADTYGLTLILGGAEVKLIDLARFYAFQAQLLRDPNHDYGLSFWGEKNQIENRSDYLSNGSWWLITESLMEVERPGINMDWRNYSNSRKIAWKTGTSHGFRDAWAVGYDADHFVAVWVGNADGEGRPGLTGVSAAGPLLFNIFQYLPQNKWFEKPEYDLKSQSLCSESGYLANSSCPKEQREVPLEGTMNGYCQFHQKVLINSDGEQVFRDCYKGKVVDTTIFMLDPVAGYYYRKKNKGIYAPIILSKDCKKQLRNSLGIVYPSKNAKLIIPKNFSGEIEKVIFKAFHSNRNKTVYWHMDDQYLGSTIDEHEITVELIEGKHKLLILDDNGNQEMLSFTAYIDL